jgi:hypothetical protein
VVFPSGVPYERLPVEPEGGNFAVASRASLACPYASMLPGTKGWRATARHRPCDLDGGAPPARPSDVGAACEDQLPALGGRAQSQELDVPLGRGLWRSVPGHGGPTPAETGGHTRVFGKAIRGDCRDKQPRQRSCCGWLPGGPAHRWHSGAAGEWGCAYAAQEVQKGHSRRCCGKIAFKIPILGPSPSLFPPTPRSGVHAAMPG